MKEGSDDWVNRLSEEWAVDQSPTGKTKDIILILGMGGIGDNPVQQHLIRFQADTLFRSYGQPFKNFVGEDTLFTASGIKELAPKGIIITDGPFSVVNRPPVFDDKIFDLGIPILGIHLGFHMWAKHIGADVRPGRLVEGQIKHYAHDLHIFGQTPLLSGCSYPTRVMQRFGDLVRRGEEIYHWASTEISQVAVAQHAHFYGVQFNPEFSYDDGAEKILYNFCFGICKAQTKTTIMPHFHER